MINKTLIVAKNRDAYEDFLEQNGLNPVHFRYVENIRFLVDYKGLVLMTGKWWQNETYNGAFYEELRRLEQVGKLSIIKRG